MSILQYASPQARYYNYDRDIMEDYDNRIDIYNTALGEYKDKAGVYQGKVDDFNKTIEDYNAGLETWREKANAYNAAIEAWNKTDRTTPYSEWSGNAASPGEWLKTAPVFEGGDAPVAPKDPGFSGADVDAFVQSAQDRAMRRANAGATAQAVMTTPGQYYIAGRENFGSNPELSMAGMSGFGSTAMGFQEGGMVPGPAFANSIVQQLPAPVQQQQQSDMQGIGGIFRQMNQGFQNQMGMMQSQPLNVYKNYLNQTYVGPQVQQETQKVDEFVGLVDQAERAHFGAEESFGFGGGPMSQQYMQQMPQPYQQQQQAQAQLDASALQGLSTQLFSEGGAVNAISSDALTEMRNKVINDYGFDPVSVAMEEGVDPELLLRVMWTENKGRQGPVSEAGAIGLMQLMPGTAKELGVDPNNPEQNARGGARYLRQQLETFQSVPLALAAYNAGPGNVRKYGGVPPFEETRNYVAQIHGVSTGEILPDMNQFYTRVEGENPSMRPQMRPEGLGTPGYVPPQAPQSEYLMMGLGSVFGGQQAQQRPRAVIPNIMQAPQEPPAQAPEEEAARGIEYYKQYAALQEPEDQRNQSLASSPRT